MFETRKAAEILHSFIIAFGFHLKMRFSAASSVALLTGSVYAVVGDWQQCKVPGPNSRIEAHSVQAVVSTGVAIHHAAQALVA